MSALSETRQAASAGSKLFLFGVALAACLCASCNALSGDALSPYKYAEAEVVRAELAGSWTPDRATFDDMVERGGYDLPTYSELILRRDGTFMMLNMPDWVGDASGASHGGTLSESGSWELKKDRGRWTINLTYSGSGTQRPANLLEQGFKSTHRFYVEFILGGPDSGHRMILVKKEKETAN
jgi:hypothetical protein